MRISMIPSAILFLAWGQCMRAFIPLGGAAAAGRDGLAGRGNPTRGNYESHIENLPARLSVPVGPNLGYTPIDHECACQRRLRQSIYGNIAAGILHAFPAQQPGNTGTSELCPPRGSSNSASTVSGIVPASGSANGGTGVTITGTGFLAGAT
jgi:hypothetical protein